MIYMVVGTRPEIIKMAPVVRACEKENVEYGIIHTGQHYSYELDKIFFDELELPRPEHNLDIGSGTHAEETGRALAGIEKILMEEKPDVVLVEGDTNSVLAGALAASKIHIKVGHVEAGLRSYSRRMPEEINRVLVDHISDYLFAPTENAKGILLGEGIPGEKIFVTGNTIVDSIYQNLEIANRKSGILKRLNLEKEGYFLVTVHRAENVDVRKRLDGVIDALGKLKERFGLPIIYPVHPRALKQLGNFNIDVRKMEDNVTMIKPVGFLDFLHLEANAKLVLTDSGGVQEETCVLRVPCVTLRDNTERPETVDAGSNILAGCDPEKIIKSADVMLGRERNWKNPFGGGNAGEKIIDILK
ncbi:MAG: UDP-N-acetylglucosamine 2-epimerase [Candidatus Altiarchaeales archaeon WOR_SM1_86-2]|nr:MAG: UDP-N-acetylglucosamine 2-epimerase [Candidatus Altiarchaeales archaeon WOR_SM1_86-2]ODS40889.1 MAG: UDP-N-acetylglucosamine 2-epimerase [Candidatus Altiarchaeales archaeon WOR_SM1_79]